MLLYVVEAEEGKVGGSYSRMCKRNHTSPGKAAHRMEFSKLTITTGVFTVCEVKFVKHFKSCD